MNDRWNRVPMDPALRRKPGGPTRMWDFDGVQLSTRACDTLARAGLKTLAEAALFTRGDFAKIKNCGRGTIAEIESAIALRRELRICCECKKTPAEWSGLCRSCYVAEYGEEQGEACMHGNDPNHVPCGECFQPTRRDEPDHFADLRRLAEGVLARGDCGCSAVLADGTVATLRIDVADPFAGQRSGR